MRPGCHSNKIMAILSSQNPEPNLGRRDYPYSTRDHISLICLQYNLPSENVCTAITSVCNITFFYCLINQFNQTSTYWGHAAAIVGSPTGEEGDPWECCLCPSSSPPATRPRALSPGHRRSCTGPLLGAAEGRTYPSPPRLHHPWGRGYHVGYCDGIGISWKDFGEKDRGDNITGALLYKPCISQSNALIITLIRLLMVF